MVSKTNYLATDAQVASLARDHLQNAQGADQARGTYLRILVAHALRELHKSQHKRHSAAESLASVETAHAHLYSVVLEAVSTPDVAAPQSGDDMSKEEKRRRAQERNRRTNFARATRSELATSVKLGLRLAAQDPSTITRDTLRSFIKAARAGPKSAPDRVEAATARLETALRDLAEEDARAAQKVIDGLEHRLQAIVTPPKRMTGTRRVKDITLHADA